MMDLTGIQASLREAQLDGWLFYDHHHRDPVAYRVLKLPPAMCTRRWYYLIPAEGEPTKLVHRIERAVLASLPGAQHEYSSWHEQWEGLQKMLSAKKRVAMQYSPLNEIPYVGLVDAGTVERVRSFGVEVVSSADLVQLFEARWSPEALALHLEAGKALHAIMWSAFSVIGDAVRAGKVLTEYDVQQEILREYGASGLYAEDPPIVAVNENASNPHYTPTSTGARPIRAGDLVLLDIWAKRQKPGAVYCDITWMGFVGEEVPARYAAVFQVVRQARDLAVNFVKQAMHDGQLIHGYEVDDVARGLIRSQGYGDYFTHRTGHSIGEDVHGNGANMDNFETHDTRLIIPRTCFSIEPGIYLKEFGVRSEVNVYAEEGDARVTGELQQEVIPLLRGSR